MDEVKVVDATGFACPRPVMMAKEAVESHRRVRIIVDNETALENVKRLGAKMGCAVTVSGGGERFEISLDRSREQSEKGNQEEGSPEAGTAPLAGPFVLVLSEDRMGRGEDQLGAVLMKAFLHTLAEQKSKPSVVILYNTGVRLAVEGSASLDDLRALESAGADVLVCGTCLDYFQVKDALAVGSVSNMYDIAETMSGAGRLLCP